MKTIQSSRCWFDKFSLKKHGEQFHVDVVYNEIMRAGFVSKFGASLCRERSHATQRMRITYRDNREKTSFRFSKWMNGCLKRQYFSGTRKKSSQNTPFWKERGIRCQLRRGGGASQWPCRCPARPMSAQWTPLLLSPMIRRSLTGLGRLSNSVCDKIRPPWRGEIICGWLSAQSILPDFTNWCIKFFPEL